MNERLTPEAEKILKATIAPNYKTYKELEKENSDLRTRLNAVRAWAIRLSGSQKHLQNTLSGAIDIFNEEGEVLIKEMKAWKD